jgi:hypothetical protein
LAEPAGVPPRRQRAEARAALPRRPRRARRAAAPTRRRPRARRRPAAQREAARVAARCGTGRGTAARAIAARQRLQQRAQLETRIQRAQRLDVRGPAQQVVGLDRQFDVAADGRELARELQRLEPGAQVLADLAGHLGRMRDQRIERAVLAEPLGRGLRADLVDARDVVRAVADQREVVDDLLGPDVELRLHAVAVVDAAAHRVDQRDAAVDQLRHVLVAGGDQHRAARGGGAPRQRADHVVGLDAGQAQQRQPERLDRLEQRLHLRAQVVGHRRPVRLVLGEQLVAEGLARRVEHDRDARRVVVLQELLQHVDHAVDRAGRLAARVGERRQRVERAVEIGGAVDEHEVRAGSAAVPAFAFMSGRWPVRARGAAGQRRNRRRRSRVA